MASIEVRRNKDGVATSYRVVWRDNGQKHTQTVPTEAAAKQWKAVLEAAGHDTAKAERALLAQVSTVPTVGDVAEHYIERLTNVERATITKYRGYLRNHLMDFTGLPVDQITEDDLIAWIRWELEQEASPKTIKNVHGFLHGVMAHAVRRQLRPDNPCNGRLLPKRNATEDDTTFLTMDEFERVISHAREWSHPVLRFLIGSGLRLSEALAVTPADFDLDGKVPTVRVVRAWKESPTHTPRWRIGPPKTRKGRRTVSLAPSTVDAIRPLVEAASAGDEVFFPPVSTQKPGVKAVQRAWNDAVRAAQAAEETPLAKKPRVQDLRHSHASLMIAAGMNLYELANRLGHESITTTADTYGHLVPDAHVRGAAAAEKAFGVSGRPVP
ncbi:MAG: site-specific integrase [Micrococcus sp.]|nr:site-specific integrase [Micrococcus sp.]